MHKVSDMRKAKGITQEEMAKILGIGESTLSMYESGQRTIPSEVAKKIAVILGVEIKDIFLPVRFTLSKQNTKEEE